jgi:hypothetical protein
VLTGLASGVALGQSRSLATDSMVQITLGAHEGSKKIVVAPTGLWGRMAGYPATAVRDAMTAMIAGRRGARIKSLGMQTWRPPREEHALVEVRLTAERLYLEVTAMCPGTTPGLPLSPVPVLSEWTRVSASLDLGAMVRRALRDAGSDGCGASSVITGRPYEPTAANMRAAPGETLVVAGRTMAVGRIMPGDPVPAGAVDSIVLDPPVGVLRVGEKRATTALLKVRAFRGGVEVPMQRYLHVVDRTVARTWQGNIEALTVGKTVVEVGEMIPGPPRLIGPVLARFTIAVVP